MVKSLYSHSREYGGWSCELEFRGKLWICKLQIWSSPFLTSNLLMVGFSDFASTIMMPILWKIKKCSWNTLLCLTICSLSIILSIKDINYYINTFYVHLLQLILGGITSIYLLITWVNYYNYLEEKLSWKQLLFIIISENIQKLNQ
jgi:hypothetical protein